ncbi:DUF1206 domain-containing protein [Marinobacter piscensis]|uniref:DUF1206 domain-containing protein n=1 Tax=Marinobacter piscensis TaxID=1562308 RepID=UPI0011A89E32|nr:DUF1206 domain-containing protein [Marinobacter piscensis]
MIKHANEHKLKWFARLGYGARGLIYTVIGGLAVMSAIGVGGGTVDSKGAIQKVMQQPLGQTLLVILLIGLLGNVSWRAAPMATGFLALWLWGCLLSGYTAFWKQPGDGLMPEAS